MTSSRSASIPPCSAVTNTKRDRLLGESPLPLPAREMPLLASSTGLVDDVLCGMFGAFKPPAE
jgi:hypothetical protein